jgi:hypothetical protein
MNAPVQPFNPAEVPINYTLNFNQVNVILAGMSELPRKQTDGFYDQFRAVALQTMQAAEAAHNAEAEKANKPEPLAEPAAKGHVAEDAGKQERAA